MAYMWQVYLLAGTLSYNCDFNQIAYPQKHISQKQSRYVCDKAITVRVDLCSHHSVCVLVTHTGDRVRVEENEPQQCAH